VDLELNKDLIIELLKIFKIEPSDIKSYPLSFFFNRNVLSYLKHETSKNLIRTIRIIEDKSFDIIETQLVYYLYMELKDTNIDTIILSYHLNQKDLKENISEKTLIQMIRMFPPKSIEF
jgi:hypothetical protein